MNAQEGKTRRAPPVHVNPPRCFSCHSFAWHPQPDPSASVGAHFCFRVYFFPIHNQAFVFSEFQRFNWLWSDVVRGRERERDPVPQAIAVVADVFFAPVVERIAERLKLPEDVAGATLLALGGAAPDIFTQAAALLEESNPDLRLAISESIGAGLFVSTFGKALTIIVGLRYAGRGGGGGGVAGSDDDGGGAGSGGSAGAPGRPIASGVAVEPYPYLRDVITYLSLLCLGYVVSEVDTVSTSLAASFILVYAIYVYAVTSGRRWMEPWLGSALGCMQAPPTVGVVGAGPKMKRDEGEEGGGGVEGGGGGREDGGGDDVELADVASFAMHSSSASSDLGGGVVGDMRPVSGMLRLVGSRGSGGEQGRGLDDVVIADGGDGGGDDEAAAAISLSRAQRRKAEGGPGGGGCGGGGDVEDNEANDDAVGLLNGGGGGGSGGGGSSISKLEAHTVATGGPVEFVGLLLRDLSTWCAEESGIADDPSSLSAKLTAPITLLMALTMCSVDKRGGKEGPRFIGPVHLTAVSFFAPVFILLAAKISLTRVANSPPLALVLLAWWTFVAWFIWIARRVPKRGIDARGSTALQALAFIQGIVWMHMCADEIVGVFQAAGRVVGVRESLLGGTLMAWGASAGDLAGMLAVARAGSPRMAITASLAGPIIQLSMGTGLSMFLLRMQGSVIQAHLAPNMAFIMVAGVMAMSYFALVVPAVHQFIFTRRTAVLIMVAYAITIVIFAILALED